MDNDFQKNAFLEAVKNKQSYRNLAYLLLTFPMGLAWFLLMIIGSSVGTGLVVIGVGVLILWLTFGLLLLAGKGERKLANSLLKADVQDSGLGAFDFDAITKGESWKTILFLFLKFPLGIMTFGITTSTISFILGLITMPFFYQYEFAQIGGRSIDSFWEALAASLFGIILLPIGLMLLNKVASLWRSLSRRLLDAPATVKQKRLSEREAIEDEVIRRLIDEGRLDEDSASYYEEKRKVEYR